MVVGTVPVWNGKVLLCRRAIEPRKGLWTLPAGYLESGETMEAGARRETIEEAGAELGPLTPFAIYDLPFVSQIYLMFRGELKDGRFESGTETLDTRLFAEADIPWDQIAFAVVHDTLKRYFADRRQGRYQFHTGVINPPAHLVSKSESHSLKVSTGR